MHIQPSDFLSGGEVDITANFRGVARRPGHCTKRTGRVSIRRVGEALPFGDYEVYVRWHGILEETVLKAGGLQECVFFSNRVTGGMDSVEDG